MKLGQIAGIPIAAYQYDFDGDLWLTNDHDKAKNIELQGRDIEALVKLSDVIKYINNKAKQ